MTIKETHDFILLVADKAQAGYFSHEEIDSTLHRASITRFNQLEPDYAKDIKARESLSPFRRMIEYSTDSDGLYTIDPAEKFKRLLGLGVTVFNNTLEENEYFDIDLPVEDEFTHRMNSQLDPVSVTSPVVDIAGVGSYQFYPKQTHAGEIRFLRLPKTPKFNYTQVGRVITFDPSGSQDLEWTETEVNKIIFQAITFLGIPLTNEWLLKNGMGLQTSDV